MDLGKTYGHNMNYLEEYINQIVELAKEVETEDPIDWAMVNIDEDAAYRLIALNVINHLNVNDENSKLTMLAVITKLTVENFILNLKLRGNSGH
jgi:hypothetical protein